VAASPEKPHALTLAIELWPKGSDVIATLPSSKVDGKELRDHKAFDSGDLRLVM
jgi:hypothetical protein